MRYLFCALALATACGTGPSLQAQRDFSQVEIKATPVAGAVHLLEGAGGNIAASVGTDGLLIVDDQFAPLAPKIEAALRGLHPGRLKFVLNTHWHGDHTGGNPHFGRESTIVAHTNVRKRLAEDSREPFPKEGLPVVTFDESLSVHFNGEEIRVIHLPPGHTDGDSVIHFTQSGVVHLGDLFFNGQFPFIDLASGGDVAGYVKNVGAVLERVPDDVRIIPGHGPLATKADLRAFHGMLLETTALVRTAVEAGKSLEEVQAAGLPDKWSSWGKGFISTARWIETCYRGSSKR